MNIPEQWQRVLNNSEKLKELFEKQWEGDAQEPIPPYLFHAFRPKQYDVLEGLFLPFAHGREIFAKLKEVFDITAEYGDTSSAYFTIQKQEIPIEELQEAARGYISSMNQILSECKDVSFVDIEHIEIKVMSRQAFEKDYNVYEIKENDLSDMRVDWLSGLLPNAEENPLVLFHEALYYMACEYDLAGYINWSLSGRREEENPFSAFFTLWKQGYKPWIVNEHLVVVTD